VLGLLVCTTTPGSACFTLTAPSTFQLPSNLVWHVATSLDVAGQRVWDYVPSAEFIADSVSTWICFGACGWNKWVFKI
jgi:hypothetical protein